jgi:Uncharacterised protein family, YAP/Alf4/glomulin
MESPRTAYSVGALILYVHTCLREEAPLILDDWMPVILSCLNGNIAIDESMALLYLYSKEYWSKNQQIPELVSIPIIEILVPLSSINPNETMRLIAFRLLAIFISLSQEGLAAVTLRDLLTYPTFPQMRVAATTILREQVIHALGRKNVSLFASSQLLLTFGSVLFRPDPPDVLERTYDNPSETKSFLLSWEAKRLMECLSFYYVLICRDQENRVSFPMEK